MHQKLYKVSIEHEIWVVAADERTAEREAEHALRDEVYNMALWAQEVTSSTIMDADWADAIPYGDHNTDETVLAWRKKLGVEYVMPEQLKKLIEK